MKRIPRTRIAGAVSCVMLIMLLAALGCEDDTGSPAAPAPTYVQVDRMAIPAINTALIPSAQKEAFNRASPLNDQASYAATVQGTITALRTAVLPRLGPEDSPGVDPPTLTGVLIPDVVTIDFSQPLVFPNGRRLEDDVIDAALGLVLNRGNVLGGGPGVADGIAANDVAFLGTFPYLAPPNVLPKAGR